jgi:hypothetical protein
MDRAEHILTVVAEEANEIAHRVSKAKRFGLQEVQPGQGMTNAARVHQELGDLVGIYMVAVREGLLPPFDWTLGNIGRLADEKGAKVERFLEISKREGTLILSGQPLVEAVLSAVWDPGHVPGIGYKGDRSLAQWQRDALESILLVQRPEAGQ